MFCGYLKHLKRTFVEEGGVKERMHALHTGYRQEHDSRKAALEAENAELRKRVAALEKELKERRKNTEVPFT